MRNFLQKVSTALSGDGEPFDTIIHLGAGQHAERSDYASLQFQKLILVEGDPEAAEVLSAAYEGEPGVQLISKLVSPAGGDIRYYRYNLSSVNGILPQGRLHSIYPRLRLLSEEILPSASLTSVIEGLEIDGSRKNLLILDLPGQECGLLDSLRSDLLRKFRFILIHGCSETLQERSKELGQTLSLLGKSHYKLVDQDAEEDLQWPHALLEFDGAIAEVAHQRDELQSAQALLNEELEKRARLLVEKATQIHQQGERIGELERVLTESSAQRDDLQAQANEVTRQRDELQSAQALLNEELENRARLLVEKATQIHQQGERIAELERVVGEVSAHRDALQGEVVTVRSQLDEANQQYGTLQSRISDLESEVTSKETLLDVLSKGRVHQDKMYEELSEERDGLLKRIETLESRGHSLEQQIQDRDGKSQLVDAEFQKVEGQMEIIKEIFLRERLK